MHTRLIYIFIFFGTISFLPLHAQQDDFNEETFWKAFGDSSWSLVTHHTPLWKQNQAYPALWRAAGYAALRQGKYLKSAEYYRHALHLNSYDTLTLITLAWNLMQTGEEQMAGSLAKRMNTSQQKQSGIEKPRIFHNPEAEFSFKFPDISDRSPARFFKLGFQSRLNPAILWSNSFSNFTQEVRLSIQVPAPPLKPGQPPRPDLVNVYDTLLIKQRQWHSGLRYAPNDRLELVIPFNLLSTTVAVTNYRGWSLGLLAGYRYSVLKLNAGIQRFNFNDTVFFQPSMGITYYPRQHTALYFGYKSTPILSSSGQAWIHSFFTGGKLGKRLWLEAFFLHGKFRNLLDQDGAYVYNTFDSGKWRTGILGRLQTKGSLLPCLSFTLDRFSSYGNSTPYFLRTLTITITWKH